MLLVNKHLVIKKSPELPAPNLLRHGQFCISKLPPLHVFGRTVNQNIHHDTYNETIRSVLIHWNETFLYI